MQRENLSYYDSNIDQKGVSKSFDLDLKFTITVEHVCLSLGYGYQEFS